MKQLLKTILPKPVLHAAREMRDFSYLAAAPRRVFNPANLHGGEIRTDGFFADEEIARSWREDHGAVIGLLDDQDRLEGVNPGDRRALYYLVRALKPRNVLEVGTHIGASTLYIARALKTNKNRGRVTTVDIVDVNAPLGAPWRKVGLGMAPKDFANQLSCLNLIEFVTANSVDFLRGAQEKFDFIFLDGDHRSHTVYQEVSAALNVLAPGGVILLHDYYPGARPLYPDDNIIGGPFRALGRAMRENPEIRVQPLGQLPWPTRQGSHATSLALLTRNTAA